MTTKLDPGVKCFVKDLSCDIVASAPEYLTILYNNDAQKSSLLNGMATRGWQVIPENENDSELERLATTLDFSRLSQTPAGGRNEAFKNDDTEGVTLNTAAWAFTRIIIGLLVTGVSAGLLSAHDSSTSKQLLVWGVGAGLLIGLGISIFKDLSSFHKITFTSKRIILHGAVRQKMEVLSLINIRSWSHHRIDYGRGYAYRIAIKMKDGNSHEIKSAAKYGPPIIFQLEKLLH